MVMSSLEVVYYSANSIVTAHQDGLFAYRETQHQCVQEV